MTTTQPPWDDETVAKLNEYQNSGQFHPYTCPNPSDLDNHVWYDRSLLATRNGWMCPKEGCDYTQNWAIAGSTTIVDATADSFPRTDSAGRGVGEVEGGLS